MEWINSQTQSFQTTEVDSKLAVGIAAGIGSLGALYSLWRFVQPSKTRIYASKDSVAAEYDKWSNDGVLEKFWGEHIHHGYFGEDGKDRIPSVKAKEILIQKLIKFAALEKINKPKSGPIKILDLGCGIGGSSRYLATHFKSLNMEVQTTGITLSPQQVSRAKQLTKEAGLQKNCFFQVADALELPFAANTFDIVWTLESGEHMPDKQKFIEQVHKVLKPKGKIMMATWCTKDTEKLTSSEKHSLEIIYKEWALPFFISLNKYKEIFATLKFKNVVEADWSVKVRKTWPLAVWDGFVGMPWLLLKGPFVFFRTLKDVFAIYHMCKGYWNGYVVYGLMTAEK